VSDRVVSKPVAWLRIARLRFYPIGLVMVATGAVWGAGSAGSFDWTRAVLAGLCWLLIQFATVLTNEQFDVATDRENTNFGPFTGGSRMIVDGALAHDAVIRAVAGAVIGIGVVSGLLVAVSPAPARAAVIVLVALGVVLGLGYTAPPLKLGYRGFGEITVAFLHSTYAMLLGWVAQGGRPAHPIPFLVSMPVFWAVLAAKTLTGIPDRESDAAVRKKSYAVIFGPKQAAGIAIVAALSASVAGLLLWKDRVVAGWFGAAYLLAVPHALILCAVLVRFIRFGGAGRRMDRSIAAALTFTLWFGLIPLATVLWLASRP
jgi:1,4-dihydroxy-2-naphthoate polyprenyltransferase